MKQSQLLHSDVVLNDVAVVIGGSSNVLLDITLTNELLGMFGRTYYVINDMIADFAHCDIAVTLHPEKLEGWLESRVKANKPLPKRVYSHITKRSRFITHQTNDWLGSSGLFAVKIALENNHKAIILCGVPMDTTNHYRRKLEWKDCYIFRKGWQRNLDKISSKTRSWNGWTMALLGAPSPEWLDVCLTSADVTP